MSASVTGSAEPYLLDTSALLTLIEDEPGAERVESVLRTHAVFIPWVALLELRYITQQERGVAEANQRYALLLALSATVLWEVDEAVLLRAAYYKARYHLSFADTLIASYANLRGATLLHKDPEYDALEGEVRLEPLPYK